MTARIMMQMLRLCVWAAVLCMVILLSAFITAFKGGKLPHSSDGNAFDSIYAIGGENENG